MTRSDGRLAAPMVWEKVLWHLGDFRGLKILDAPAGKGFVSEALQERGGRVFPLDIVEIEIPLKNKIKSDLNTYLPFKHDQFDRIICIEGIEHLQNPFSLIKEFSRILSYNGTLIITTPNTLNFRSRIKFLFTGNLFWFGDYAIKRFGHITPLFPYQLIFFLKSSGFSEIQIDANRKMKWMKWLSLPLRAGGILFRENYNSPEIISGEILIIKAKKRSAEQLSTE
jgi:ubiquinone/menaquinone biosynthesis C-methylase UbiE